MNVSVGSIDSMPPLSDRDAWAGIVKRAHKPLSIAGRPICRLFIGPDETGAVILYEQHANDSPRPVSVQCGTWDTWVSVAESIGGLPSAMIPVAIVEASE